MIKATKLHNKKYVYYPPPTPKPITQPTTYTPFLLFPPPRHRDVSVTYVELRRIRRRHRRRHAPSCAIMRRHPPATDHLAHEL